MFGPHYQFSAEELARTCGKGQSCILKIIMSTEEPPSDPSDFTILVQYTD